MARCVREAILPRVYPQAWELIRRLRAEGEQMLIISASVSLLVQAVAAALEIDQALGIDVAMVDGGYSGEITGIPSYQQGKVARLAQWREAHPEYDGEVTFYTDSINDLPLCLHADRVRLVNPLSAAAGGRCRIRLAGAELAAGIAERINFSTGLWVQSSQSG